MFLINALAKPKKSSEHYDKVVGAYVSLYIDYKDISGALELAKYYIKDEGWKLTEIEEEYFTLDSINDVDQEQKELYEEAVEYGYTIVFNCYQEEGEEEEE
ncbi:MULTISPECIES: hypothetical protein [Tenacibaculum]|uniref:Uncharacterized protein n=2 Tax=Tenacibaculum finnmarkense TaxID=2781243 RepID=A0A2I2M8N9_9FLAO|nr:hypothetical protein [Tenacibaculum finnmarkense]ALU75693.1 hypothetical protein AUW17_10715 [Tenacibaculum dicentrarchi]MBE7633123.1 hypothetical protein [Tenacibaculum finnmarkense genomovar ulcerans]MBE7644778.1 hypothetical protein [Tenacibaculum finnmarkense genomovar ulcerans]MBE7646945.1 hypothetical protein [Tenacibaculum finnmarkense genomovar ulcerans]MBE7686719.1 hypothetical protein [Tenacibaculum finnmarkense genomovar ulcerans]